MYFIAKRLLFLLPPELAHKLTMKLLILAIRWLKLPLYRKKNSQSVEFCGIKYKNRLGMAAGFDKNAEYVDILDSLGFGYVEIGTVTPLPQEGNPKPRLFRLKHDEALLNRMGFNNQGVDSVVENLKKHQSKGYIIGGNIGKNKVTPNEEAYKDYEICFDKMYEYVDYFVVNVSSPNTPNLRELQDKSVLLKIFSSLHTIRSKKTVKKPIFLKLAPDLNLLQLDDILSVYDEIGIEALIVANTTLDYTILKKDREFAIKENTGGISGKPLYDKTYAMIQYIKKKNNTIKIIGVGGIDSGVKAKETIDHGCELIQIYTGFIYKGTPLINDILNEIT